MEEIKKENRETLFSKEQLLSCGKFTKRKDLLCAVLSDSKQYSAKEAEREIDKFLKRKVK